MIDREGEGAQDNGCEHEQASAGKYSHSIQSDFQNYTLFQSAYLTHYRNKLSDTSMSTWFASPYHSSQSKTLQQLFTVHGVIIISSGMTLCRQECVGHVDRRALDADALSTV